MDFRSEERRCLKNIVDLNKDQATAADVMNLMNQVSDKVYEMSGVRLEPEVKRLGVF